MRSGDVNAVGRYGNGRRRIMVDTKEKKTLEEMTAENETLKNENEQLQQQVSVLQQDVIILKETIIRLSMKNAGLMQ